LGLRFRLRNRRYLFRAQTYTYRGCCRLVAGTYYGQWVTGLRHGYGVRQSAPFNAATPVRYDDARLQRQTSRPRHHNSMPVLNSSLSISPDVDADRASPQPVAPLSAEPQRGRSGFVLTGDRDAPETVRRTQRRSRSTSVRRRIADSVSVFSSMNRRKRKPESDARTNDASSQVRLYATLLRRGPVISN